MTIEFAALQPANEALGDRLAEVIRQKANRNPRGLVKAIGPSEVGEPCVRRLAYRITDQPKTNEFSDPWPSVSGTAIHAWLAEAFEADKSGHWLTEKRVKIREGLSGNVDLFDMANGIVIDHKCVGATSMKSRKASGPTEQQLAQINLYAYGLKQEGYQVHKVALAFYPLGGMLSGLHMWVGDYDEQIALDALDRLDNAMLLTDLLKPQEKPENWSAIPATFSRNCMFCPYYLPKSDDLSLGCPGE